MPGARPWAPSGPGHPYRADGRPIGPEPTTPPAGAAGTSRQADEVDRTLAALGQIVAEADVRDEHLARYLAAAGIEPPADLAGQHGAPGARARLGRPDGHRASTELDRATALEVAAKASRWAALRFVLTPAERALAGQLHDLIVARVAATPLAPPAPTK